jgi:hypothetical protein
MSKLLWSPTKNEIKNTQAWEFIQDVNNKFETKLDSFRGATLQLMLIETQQMF